MNILSIDWDYFFPNTAAFDWSASETCHVHFYQEAVWPLRYYNTAMFGINKGAMAKDIMCPDTRLLDRFWNHIFSTGTLQVNGLAIVESHEDLLTIMQAFGETYNVWNFDAHHDFGYVIGNDKSMKAPNCGNWAINAMADGLIENYTLVYPPWRKKEPESWQPQIDIHYEAPFELSTKVPKFDYIFICRSGAWTPPWADEKYLEFIGYWKKHEVWSRLLSIKSAMSARNFDLEAAKAHQENWQAQLENMKKAS